MVIQNTTTSSIASYCTALEILVEDEFAQACEHKTVPFQATEVKHTANDNGKSCMYIIEETIDQPDDDVTIDVRTEVKFNCDSRKLCTCEIMIFVEDCFSHGSMHPVSNELFDCAFGLAVAPSA